MKQATYDSLSKKWFDEFTEEYGIAHGEEVSRVDRDEKLEVNFFGGELVGELGEEMLELTVLA